VSTGRRQGTISLAKTLGSLVGAILPGLGGFYYGKEGEMKRKLFNRGNGGRRAKQLCVGSGEGRMGL